MIGGSGAKKYGGKMMLTIAVMLWSLSTFLVPFFAHSIYALILSRVLLGLGEGLGIVEYSRNLQYGLFQQLLVHMIFWLNKRYDLRHMFLKKCFIFLYRSTDNFPHIFSCHSMWRTISSFRLFGSIWLNWTNFCICGKIKCT